MQWDDLKIFLAIAREGSISGAAKRLAVQHSTVSRRLRSLEERLDTRLIERKTSGYALTEAGEETVARRGGCLAIALVLEGADRTTAAATCGMDRQTLR